MSDNVRLWGHNVPVDDAVKFVMTADHLTLLRRSYVMDDLSGIEFGAAWIDPKRPYGNSDVLGDILEILGWDESREDDARRIHSETPRALQIVLTTGEFRAGVYRRDKPWLARGWHLADGTTPVDNPLGGA